MLELPVMTEFPLAVNFLPLEVSNSHLDKALSSVV